MMIAKKQILKIRLCIRMSGTALGENKMVIPKREEAYSEMWNLYLQYL